MTCKICVSCSPCPRRLLSTAAAAQDDLDALAAATEQVDSGMALARRQIAASDLPGALGTLERVLSLIRRSSRPASSTPRCCAASTTARAPSWSWACSPASRSPIRTGPGVEAACGPVPRPAPPRRRSDEEPGLQAVGRAAAALAAASMAASPVLAQAVGVNAAIRNKVEIAAPRRRRCGRRCFGSG
jgi:hypothetical protein